MIDAERDYATTERVALVVYYLMEGGAFPVSELALRIGMSRPGAYRLLSRISRVVPIYCDDGCWQLLTRQPDQAADQEERSNGALTAGGRHYGSSREAARADSATAGGACGLGAGHR